MRLGAYLGIDMVETLLDYARKKATVEARRVGAVPHLNTFMERGAIEAWARQIGFRETTFIGGCEAPWAGEPLGQSASRRGAMRAGTRAPGPHRAGAGAP